MEFNCLCEGYIEESIWPLKSLEEGLELRECPLKAINLNVPKGLHLNFTVKVFGFLEKYMSCDGDC